MTIADRFLRHAQALENHAMHAQSRRATAKLLREAASELKK
jgi:hypothetical protein